MRRYARREDATLAPEVVFACRFKAAENLLSARAWASLGHHALFGAKVCKHARRRLGYSVFVRFRHFVTRNRKQRIACGALRRAFPQ